MFEYDEYEESKIKLNHAKDVVKNVVEEVCERHVYYIEKSFDTNDDILALIDDDDPNVALIKDYSLRSQIYLEFIDVLNKEYNHYLQKITELRESD